MKFQIENANAAPERTEMDAILREYYDLSNGRLMADGGPAFSVKDAIQDFWDHLSDILPPNGRLLLGRDKQGNLLGCGTLVRVRPGVGEMKRLFVRPAARGTGLGRALIDVRIAEARDMGLSAIIADTLRKNLEMQRLYETLGFEQTPTHIDSGTLKGFPELEPYMLFYKLKLE